MLQSLIISSKQGGGLFTLFLQDFDLLLQGSYAIVSGRGGEVELFLDCLYLLLDWLERGWDLPLKVSQEG